MKLCDFLNEESSSSLKLFFVTISLHLDLMILKRHLNVKLLSFFWKIFSMAVFSTKSCATNWRRKMTSINLLSWIHIALLRYNDGLKSMNNYNSRILYEI